MRKLLPGHRLVVEHERVKVEQYWRYPRAEAEPLIRSEPEWEEELIDLLRDAVRLRLMSDVPLGAMLSGGLDSSLIVALMAAESTRPVKTFSVGFAGVPDNELPVARETAHALRTEHHELELSLDDPVDLETLIWSLDEPVADLSAIGFMALSQLTARHVTVALSGQGADELLAGYDRYRQVAAIERWSRAPASVRRAVGAAARGCRDRHAFVEEQPPLQPMIRSSPARSRDRSGWRRSVPARHEAGSRMCHRRCSSWRWPIASMARLAMVWHARSSWTGS